MIGIMNEVKTQIDYIMIIFIRQEPLEVIKLLVISQNKAVIKLSLICNFK